MADNTLSIQASSQLQGAIQQLNALAKSLGLAGAAGNQAATGVGAAGKAAAQSGSQASGASKSWGDLNSTLLTTASAYAAFQNMKESVDLLVQQEQAINILVGATGSIEKARDEYERWREVTETLGNEFNRSSIIYARFLTTAEQAGIPVQNARAAADGLAIAQRAMNLSSYDAELAFRALGQIANKTVVNMEELRQQLGERVAGVMDSLSKKMGVTTKELFKMTETGELSAQVFFEKFGPAMAQAFKDQAIVNADSLAANLERIGNAANRMRVEFASGFGKELNEFLKNSPETTKTAEQGFRGFGEGVGVAVGWLTKLFDYLHGVRAVFAAAQSVITLFVGTMLKNVIGPLVTGIGYLEAQALRAAAAITEMAGAKDAAKNLRETADKVGGYGKALSELGNDAIETGIELANVAKEQAKFQMETDKAAASSKNAADKIKELADGATTTETAFNKLDPAISKFIDKMNGLKEQTEIVTTAYERMMKAQNGVLNPEQLASFRNEVEKLVRAYDFKDIPEKLKSLADTLGVATTETKKNTEAVKQQAAANRELLQEINKVTDALENQAKKSKEAFEENEKKIKELEQKNLTGIDPEELNLLDELQGKRFGLRQQAERDERAATDARKLLADANRAAGQTAEEAALQYDKAAMSLLGVEEASQNARDRLLELQAAFASSGGAAGRFAAPGGSPGAPSGPGIGPFTPGLVPPGGMGVGGAPPPGFGYGPGGNEYKAPGQLWGGSDENGNPIDLFNALDTGIPGTDPNVIAQMLVEQWTSAADKALLQAVKEAPSTNPVQIETKDTSLGKTNPPSGGFVGPAQEAQTLITNVEEAADQAGEVLVDSFSDGSKAMFNLGIAAKDAGKEIKGIGDETNKNFVGPIQQAADAVGQIPTAANDASAALAEAAGAGVDYSDAIIRAEGATGDLGFTAEAMAGSIAEAAGATTDLGNEAERAADRIGIGQERMRQLAGMTTGELIKQLEILLQMDEVINGPAGGGAEAPAGE